MALGYRCVLGMSTMAVGGGSARRQRATGPLRVCRRHCRWREASHKMLMLRGVALHDNNRTKDTYLNSSGIAATFHFRNRVPTLGLAVITQNGIATTNPLANGTAQTTATHPA
jgi:hypothetical protein